METAPVVALAVLGAVVGLILLFFAALCIVRLWNEYVTWGYYEIQEDMSGKVVVVTGGTAGLGFEASREFAKAGATVVWGARSLEKAEARRAELMHSNPQSIIEFFPLDMNSLTSVQEFIQEVSSKFSKIDLLVCNAGMQNEDRSAKTKDGFEVHFGINFLAHFFMIKGIMDNLMNSDAPRVVMVSSTAMSWGILDFSNPDSFVYNARLNDPNGRDFLPPAYFDSKLEVALLSRELANRHNGQKISFFATCPGYCKTEATDGSKTKIPPLKQLAWAPLLFAMRRSGWRGACNLTHAATASALESGSFYAECKLARKQTDELEEMVRGGEGQKLIETAESCINKVLNK